MAKARKGGEARRQLTVTVGGQAYSIPSEHVLEVGRRPAITRVPNSPAPLAGLMNFHGVAIPVVRVSTLVEMTAAACSTPSREAKIVVYDMNGAVALLIDDVMQLTGGQRNSASSLNVEALLAETFAGTSQTPRHSVERLGDRVGQTALVEEKRALLAFRVAGQDFALPLESVGEVLKLPANVTGLPRSDAASVGMITLRNQVVPLISLAALLGLTGHSDEQRHVVLIRFGEARIGLVADTMSGVIRIADSSIEPVPAILQRGAGEAEIDAIARGQDRRPLISILSPSRLFRNQAISRALADLEAEDRNMPESLLADADHRFVIFNLGDDVFGLPIGAVDEIVELPTAISRVPNAPEFVAGVVNVRGRAVPIIDQRVRFNMGQGASAKRPRVIVVTVDRLQAGFIVDSVSEILSVPASSIGQAPQLPGNGTRVFDRVAARGDAAAMILLVDPKELLDKAERDLLKRFKPAAGTAQPL